LADFPVKNQSFPLIMPVSPNYLRTQRVALFLLGIYFPFQAMASTDKAQQRSDPEDSVRIYQTSRDGDRLRLIEVPGCEADGPLDHKLLLEPGERYQEFLGVGGSFTESAAEVFYELSEARRKELLAAFFSPDGAHYSLTRTHIASCDFSLRNYTYAPVAGDLKLEHFSIEPDRTWLLPFIKAAQAVPGADFRIVASPWTAPPWMKDNKTWNGGKLLEEYYGPFSDYMVKYLQAYAGEGIPVWAITPMNEPLGNGANWESTHFSPAEMRDLIRDHLGPALREAGLDTLVWIYDQNRGHELKEWVDIILADPEAARFVEGTAVHWYDSTVSSHGENLDYVHDQYPGKKLIHSEGCIDAMGDDEQVGVWLEDDWYWRPEATDWGFFWANEQDKVRHPPYRPFHRYARDLIEGINHHLSGWIDWNLLLNTRGGPNHARNYCLAPVLVDSGQDRIFYTPLYYAMAQVSKFVRPGAVRIGLSGQDNGLLATALHNPDGSIVVVLFNTLEKNLRYSITLPGSDEPLVIPIKAQAMQSVLLPR
jgi:glucosylceramidase